VKPIAVAQKMYQSPERLGTPSRTGRSITSHRNARPKYVMRIRANAADIQRQSRFESEASNLYQANPEVRHRYMTHVAAASSASPTPIPS
jgi:hypothetical protein